MSVERSVKAMRRGRWTRVAALALVVASLATVCSGGAGAARATRPYDSCTLEQADNDASLGVFDVVVRGVPSSPIALAAPRGWACRILDGNGSGASVDLFSPQVPADSPRAATGIAVSVSASVRDGIGSGICPYSTYRHWDLALPCDAANSARPRGVSVTYLAGGANSSHVAIMIVTPADAAPPVEVAGLAHVVTLSVLVTRGANFDMWMTCRLGARTRTTCVRDARAFARALGD